MITDYIYVNNYNVMMPPATSRKTTYNISNNTFDISKTTYNISNNTFDFSNTPNNISKTSLYIATLTPGVYFITIKCKDYIYNSKFIKQ